MCSLRIFCESLDNQCKDWISTSRFAMLFWSANSLSDYFQKLWIVKGSFRPAALAMFTSSYSPLETFSWSFVSMRKRCLNTYFTSGKRFINHYSDNKCMCSFILRIKKKFVCSKIFSLLHPDFFFYKSAFLARFESSNASSPIVFMQFVGARLVLCSLLDFVFVGNFYNEIYSAV